MALSPRKKILEKDIQFSILQYLTLKKVFHWRNNSGAFKTERDGFMRFGAVGSPDIFAVHKGSFYGIEVKTPIGKLSPNQIEFGGAFEKAGGIYLVARKVEDVISYGL